MEKAPEQKPRPETVEVKSWGQFEKAIKGWFNHDGYDRCPGCWEKYLARFADDPKMIDIITKDAVPLNQKLVHEREKTHGKLYTNASGADCMDCGKTVLRPDPEKKTEDK